MTRPLSFVLTPCHILIGASVSQLSLFLQFSPSVAQYSATKASLSLVAAAESTDVAAAQYGRLIWSRSLFTTYFHTAGRHPSSQLSERYNSSRLVRSPSSDGIVLSNWLLPRLRLASAVRLPSSGGIGPFNWLLPRLRYVSAVRLPNSIGIIPLNWLLPRLRYVSAVRLPNSGGILPFSWFQPSLSSMTRPLSSVVTPFQVPSGASESQLSL